ncbi:MAG TPA: hypothetical protein VFW68_00945 [Rhodocyclaceae bacterium]|nr:hypothetical protein [Rhodocyclaceae bacterium]
MALEITETYARLSRLPLLNMRWAAVFAGLVVGISANLFLLLVGGAVGLAVFNTTPQSSSQGIAIAAGIWNTFCMIVGAFIGGYVAARASGLRRTPDGVLHGAVAWSVTMLLSALLAGSAAGSTLSGMFATVANRVGGEPSVVLRSVDTRDRQAAVNALQNSLGLSPDQAGRIVDQALIESGRAESASEQGRAEVRGAARSTSIAIVWLSASILLSLLAAMGGGMLGAHATRRVGGKVFRREASLTGSETSIRTE